MRFTKLGDSVVNPDRVLCIQIGGGEGHEDKLAVTYDTGQVVFIPDKEPMATLKSYLESLSPESEPGTTSI